MERTTQPDENVEHEKLAIMEHLEELMKANGIDSRELVMMWQPDNTYARWFLYVLHGKSQHVLKFTVPDLVHWTTYKAVVLELYKRAIDALIDWLREQFKPTTHMSPGPEDFDKSLRGPSIRRTGRRKPGQ